MEYEIINFDNWYLRIDENNKVFGFVNRKINVIEYNDIAITKQEYEHFFDLQTNGIQFKLLDVKLRKPENGLFGYIIQKEM